MPSTVAVPRRTQQDANTPSFASPLYQHGYYLLGTYALRTASRGTPRSCPAESRTEDIATTGIFEAETTAKAIFSPTSPTCAWGCDDDFRRRPSDASFPGGLADAPEARPGRADARSMIQCMQWEPSPRDARARPSAAEVDGSTASADAAHVGRAVCV